MRKQTLLLLAALACAMQATAAQEIECSPIDLIFVIDTSGSICDMDNSTVQLPGGGRTCNNWQTLQNAVNTVAAAFDSRTRVGYIGFGSSVFTYGTLSPLRLDATTFRYLDGNTDTYNALLTAVNMFDTSPESSIDRPNRMIVLTDGKPTVPTQTVAIELVRNISSEIRARRGSAAIQVTAVGITDSVNVETLEIIATDPSDVYSAVSFEALEEILADLIEGTCQIVPSNCQQAILDVVFAIDGSGSICDNDDSKIRDPAQNNKIVDCDNWGFIHTFLNNFVSNLNIGPLLGNIGLVRFDNDAQALITLGDECSASSGVAQDCIKNRLTYEGGNTFTSKGLEIALNMTTNRRPNARPVVIVVTDGKATRPSNDSYAEAKALEIANRIKASDVPLYAIGISDDVKEEFIRELSSPPQVLGDTYFLSPTFINLNAILGEILEVTCTAPCRVPPQVCFMVDASVSRRKLKQVKAYLGEVLDELGVTARNVTTEVRAAVVSFGRDTQVVCGFGNRNCDVDTIVRSAGKRYTEQAIEKCAELFVGDAANSANRSRKAVIISNGQSTNKETVIQTARAARQGFEILSVTIGSWVDMFEMKSVTSHHYNNYLLPIASYDDLSSSNVDALISKVCMSIDACNPSPCQNGGTCVQRVDSYICECAQGWSGPQCTDTCREPADVVFSLDMSPSRNVWLDVVDFAKNVSYYLPVGFNQAYVAETTFSDTSQAIFYLGNHTSRAAVLDAMTTPINRRGYAETRPWVALAFNREQMFVPSGGDRADRRNVNAFILDGKSRNRTASWEAARLSREAGINNVAVGIKATYTEYLDEVRDIGGHASNVFTPATFSALPTIYQDVAAQICNNVDACTSSPCQNGATCRDTFVTYICDCPDGFSGKQCDRDCDGALDLTIVLDRSGSIRSENLRTLQQFVVDVLGRYNILGGQVRVSLVTFAEQATVEFCFNTYSHPADIYAHIYQTSSTDGYTNVASALRTVTDSVLTSACGRRQEAKSVVMILSDVCVNRELENTHVEAARLKLTESLVVGVSAGEVSMNMMNVIVSKPAPRNSMHVSSVTQMNAIINDFVGATCNNVNDCNGVTCQNGGTCVDDYNDFRCDGCTNGNTGKTCERSCGAQKDVVLILDTSGSMNPDMCALGMEFLLAVVEGLNIRPGGDRVAFVTYSNVSSVDFGFMEYSSKFDVKLALNCINRAMGVTNTAAALNSATQLFNANPRVGATLSVIHASDGPPNVNVAATVPAGMALQQVAKVYGVGIGATRDDTINRQYSDWYSEVNQSSEIASVASNLLDDLCA